MYISFHLKGYHVISMYWQKDVDFQMTCAGDDLRENYIPASFDEYLMNATMHHKGHRRTTKCKLQSDYEEPDVILFFVQIRYKALGSAIRQLLTHISCADRHHQGHRRRRPDSGGSRLLRRGLLLRNGRAHPQRRHRLPRRHLDPHLRDQLLHTSHQDARPVHRPAPFHDTVHRACV
jgi:hypothetical protein